MTMIETKPAWFKNLSISINWATKQNTNLLIPLDITAHVLYGMKLID